MSLLISKEYLIRVALSIVAVFAPAKQVVFTVIVLTLADMVTGILASRKQGHPITSSGLKRTVAKIAIYEVAILASYLVGMYLTGPYIPVLNICSSLVGLTELKSVLENLDTINGGSFFRSMTDKLSSYAKLDPPSDP